MLKAIYAYVDAGGDGLDPPVREAIVHLKSNSGKPGHVKETSFQGT